MKFTPLKWGCEEYQMDGTTLQRTKAFVKIRFKNGDYKICRSYMLYRNNHDEWCLGINETGACDTFNETVESFDAGKAIAEHNYQNYMQELYAGVSNYLRTE